jgi:aminopeptidase-like protein
MPEHHSNYDVVPLLNLLKASSEQKYRFLEMNVGTNRCNSHNSNFLLARFAGSPSKSTCDFNCGVAGNYTHESVIKSRKMVVKSLKNILEDWDLTRYGQELYELIVALYPICRSITGDGLRRSLRQLQALIPLSLREVPTGTQVFDWTVPKEWNIRDAWIKNAHGEKIMDFSSCNLHVVNYSVPVHRKLRLKELEEHVFTLPEKPDWIPYRTSYYKESWGICLSHRQWEGLPDDEYEVYIDSTLKPGNLTYGEFRIQGATDEEVLISCHSCHPSLCNDNLSGMAVAAKMAQLLTTVPLHYSYRFVWTPGTIGAITWLASNENILPNIRHGLVISCIGDPGKFNYKRSRQGNAEIDRIVEYVFRQFAPAFEVVNFTPYGYDERQYGSPGINLPVGCFMRTPNGQYPQYHTSADDLNFVTGPALAESLQLLLRIINVLEQNASYLNLNPKCEPQLGRRGLYRQVGGTSNSNAEEAILWVLNFSDGKNSLLDIAERSRLGFEIISKATELLLSHNLLKRAE